MCAGEGTEGRLQLMQKPDPHLIAVLLGRPQQHGRGARPVRQAEEPQRGGGGEVGAVQREVEPAVLCQVQNEPAPRTPCHSFRQDNSKTAYLWSPGMTKSDSWRILPCIVWISRFEAWPWLICWPPGCTCGTRSDGRSGGRSDAEDAGAEAHP